MYITFKDVGQGDSILFEWLNENGKLQIGLIDCNKKKSANPILEYLKSLRDYDFKFILLSHPHTDHFSGLLEVLNYLKETKIKLDYFLHTCSSDKNYLLSSLRSVTWKNVLIQIFRLKDELYENRLIDNVTPVAEGSIISISSNLNLQFIHPNNSSISNYNARANRDFNLYENNPTANLLSTFVKISFGKEFVIFTSDLNAEAFYDTTRKGHKNLKSNCLLGQISHHGSKDSFESPFWKVLSRDKKCFAVISVGENTYGHPYSPNITELQKLNYNVLTTSDFIPGGSVQTFSDFDMVSVLQNVPQVRSRDLKFEVSNGRCVLI